MDSERTSESTSSTEEIQRDESEHHPEYSVAGPEASGRDNTDDSKANEDKPGFSLAGPDAEEKNEEYDSYDSDEGFGKYGRRPKAEYGVSKPFPRAKRGDRWKKSHKKQRMVKLGHSPDADEQGAATPDTDRQRLTRNESSRTTATTGTRKSKIGSVKYPQLGDNVEPNFWFGIRRAIREPLAEWLASMVLQLMGISANLQYMTSEGQYGGFSQMAAMWGLAYMMAIHIAGGISGGHCSPVVSINFFVFRGFPARKTAIYILAQIFGSFCGILIAYGIYKDAIRNYDPEKTVKSGQAIYTMPNQFTTGATAFLTDFTSAAVMSGSVLAMGDSYNAPPAAGMHAFIMGLVGTAVTGCLGYNTGPQVNPAKDLASRIVTLIVGYGTEMWQGGWWAQAWFAAIFGGLFGCLLYDIAIYEGPESPVNYPRHKVRQSAKGNKAKLFETGLFGTKKKRQAKQDLENGTVGINSRHAGRDLGGHPC